MLQLETIDPRNPGSAYCGSSQGQGRHARGCGQPSVAAVVPTYVAVGRANAGQAGGDVKLAAYFGRRVWELVRPGGPVVDFQPASSRVAEEMDRTRTRRSLSQTIDDLQRTAADYRETVND